MLIKQNIEIKLTHSVLYMVYINILLIAVPISCSQQCYNFASCVLDLNVAVLWVLSAASSPKL